MDKTLVAILSSSDGRDRLLKTFQYTLKTIIWGLSFKKQKNEAINKNVTTLQKTLSDGRRLFRMGNWIEVFREVRDGPDFTKGFFLCAAEYLSTLLGLVVTIADDVSWTFKFSGSSNPIQKKISQLGDTAWTLSILLDLISLTKNITSSWNKEVRLKELLYKTNGSVAGVVEQSQEATSNDLKTLYKERQLLYLNELKLVVDFPIAFTYASNRDTNPGIIAIAGLISAFIGLYKSWLKVRKV